MSCLADDRKNLQNSLQGKEIRNVVVLTLSFQVVFTAFNALQNLHSSVHDEQRLGLISLTVLYFTSALSSVVSPTVIGYLGARTVLAVFFLFHCVYVGFNFFPTFATMLPAAALVGLLFGPAWTSQGLYIAANADSYCRGKQTSPYVILDRFNWFFFTGLASSQVLGNLVTSLVLHQGGVNSTLDDVISSCGVFDCHTNENYTKLDDPHGQPLTIILSVYLACTAVGVVLVISLLPPLPRRDWLRGVSARESVASCCGALFRLDLLLLVPFILYTAVQNAFLIGTYTASYVSCPLGLSMVGYVMAAYGTATPALSFFFGLLAKLVGRFLCLTLAMGAHIGLLVILYHWAPDESDAVSLFVVPVLWGVSECVVITQANSLIVNLNDDASKGQAFAHFHTWRGLGYCLTFLCSTYLCVSTTILLTLACAVLAVVFYVVFEFKSQIRQRVVCQQKEEDDVMSRSSSDADVSGLDRQLSDPSTVSSPLMSPQERVTFDHPELNDVIKEAQLNWNRDPSGPTLDLKRAMSHKHLLCSKATLLYQARLIASVGGTSGISRSFSDSHVKSLPARQSYSSADPTLCPSCDESATVEIESLRETSVEEDFISDVNEIDYANRKKIFHIESDSDSTDAGSNERGKKWNGAKRKRGEKCRGWNQEEVSRMLKFELVVPPPRLGTSDTAPDLVLCSSLEGVSLRNGSTNYRNGHKVSPQHAHSHAHKTSPLSNRSDGEDRATTVAPELEGSPPASPGALKLRRSLARSSRGSFKSIALSISGSFRFSKRIHQLSRTGSQRSSRRSNSDRSSWDTDSNGFVPEDGDSVAGEFPLKKKSSGKTIKTEEDRISIY